MRGGWARKAFVVTEIALAVALVMGAGLLGRSLIALANVDMGFQSDRLVVLRTVVPVAGRDDFPRAIATYRTMLDGGSRPARRHRGRRRDVAADGRSLERRLLDRGRTGTRGARHEVAAGALQRDHAGLLPARCDVPIVRGRDFTDGDRIDAPFVAIINEQLAKDAFPGVDPIGRDHSRRARLARADDHRRHRERHPHARAGTVRCKPRSSCRTNSIRGRPRRSTS